MRVLLAEPDTFGAIGGGQTVVASLARSRPDWTFVNASRLSPAPVPSFPNATLLPIDTRIDMGAAYPAAQEAGRWHRYDYEDAINAWNLAWTFRGQSFDVVEVPDYVSYGRFLPAAFARHGVSVGRVIQSLHGRLSITYEYEWFKVGTRPNAYDAARRRAEDLSLNVADVRYGLSVFYRRELQERTRLPIVLVDPLLCVDIPNVDGLPAFAAGTEPQLVFVSRLERLKAPDRFVDLLWHLGDRAPGRRLVIGSEVQLGGVSGKGRVEAHQRHRHVEGVEYLNPLPPAELAQRIFRQPSIVVLPTRHDTFNLTVLEAVLHGCPVVLGTNCGAYDYLHSTFPGASVVGFDEHDVPATAERLARQVGCFEQARAATLEAVRRAAPRPDADSIVRAFETEAASDPAARAEAARDFDDILRILSDLVGGLGVSSGRRSVPPVPSQHRPEEPLELELAAIRDLARRSASFRLYQGRAAGRQPEEPSALAVVDDLSAAQDLMRLAGGPRGPRGLEFLSKASAVPTPHAWAAMSDRQRQESAAAIRLLLKQAPTWLRTRLTLALADGEAASGNDLLAAVYRVRVVRWLGDDRFRLLPSVVGAAEAAGLNEAGRAAGLIALHVQSEQDTGGVQDYLQERFRQLRELQIPDDCEDLRESRRSERYRVSVIVSMYDVGAEVLERFVRMLGSLTMIGRGEAEVIFVDSGSPTPQWPLLAPLLERYRFDSLFVRTGARETIQSAWNRGIRLSRGSYLALLGTDEGLHPAALDELANHLDAQPSVDWVMSDSVVTKVDRHGVHLDDKMAYLRAGNWSQASLLFDCTYLGYVGGLMRRTVYDRFGFYDPTFTGAGDTEFKCRVHPFVQTAHIPKTLGVFYDYPADRVTASCKVELEDVRAWYLFRTPGGIRYLFQNADTANIEEAFWGMLANRRSFTRGPESDLQFALRLLGLLREREPRSPVLTLEPRVRELLTTTRDLGWQADWSVAGFRATANQLRRAELIWGELAAHCPARAFPTSVVSDAQFFAHSWVWG